MEQHHDNYFADLTVLGDYLEEGTLQGWSHSLRKNILLLLHKLKTSSRKSGNSNLADELVALEVSLGFGAGNDFQPDESKIEDHQLRILELIDNSEEPEVEEPEAEEPEAEEPEAEEPEAEEPEAEEPEAEEPEVEEAEVEEAEVEEPEVEEPEVEEPEVEEPEVEEIIIEYEAIDDTQPYDQIETTDEENILDEIEYPHEVKTNEDKTNKQGIIQLVMCNCPGRDAARELARHLIEARLAACINIIANIGSIYWWKGEIHDTAECQLQIKTSHQSLNDVIDYIKQYHPGEVPEILVIPINEGNKEYFKWVKQETYDRE